MRLLSQRPFEITLDYTADEEEEGGVGIWILFEDWRISRVKCHCLGWWRQSTQMTLQRLWEHAG